MLKARKGTRFPGHIRRTCQRVARQGRPLHLLRHGHQRFPVRVVRGAADTEGGRSAKLKASTGRHFVAPALPELARQSPIREALESLNRETQMSTFRHGDVLLGLGSMPASGGEAYFALPIDGFSGDSGPSRGDPCRRAIRPTATSSPQSAMSGLRPSIALLTRPRAPSIRCDSPPGGSRRSAKRQNG
jgi:hypothetical protein